MRGRKKLAFLISMAGWDASVNPVAVRNCSAVGVRERDQTVLFSPLYDWTLFLHNSMPLPSRFCVAITVESERNGTNTWVYIKIM